MKDQFLKETRMLNYRAESIQNLVEARGWRQMEEYERIGAIFEERLSEYFDFSEDD